LNDFSEQPDSVDRMMALLGHGSKTGAAILSPKLVHELRVLIVGKEWEAIDAFPGWNMADINPVVDLAGDVDRTLADVPARPLSDYVDVGVYGLDAKVTADLDRPSTLPGFSTVGLVTPLEDDLVSGDGPNPERAPLHGESERLADVWNRLSLNRLEGVAPMTAIVGGQAVGSPEDLVRALMATGHTVTVADARYFANFGHLHYEGRDVMMPFWVNSEVWIPGVNRQLKIPVSHAEYEWFIRGPKINADVAFYFGIDGKAEFRTMDQLDQAWVMGRHAHEYRGADAVEVTRLTGLLMVAYAHAHRAYPRLAFGGYYALGVCQDGVAAIERKMTGKATLFPNTADMAYFHNARDAEVDALMAAIPKDRGSAAPQLERVFGSLPTTDFAAISIPGLGADLERVHTAWQEGTLRYRRWPVWNFAVALGLCVVGVWWVLVRWRAGWRRVG
jgi:hypothetical protein